MKLYAEPKPVLVLKFKITLKSGSFYEWEPVEVRYDNERGIIHFHLDHYIEHISIADVANIAVEIT